MHESSGKVHELKSRTGDLSGELMRLPSKMMCELIIRLVTDNSACNLPFGKCQRSQTVQSHDCRDALRVFSGSMHLAKHVVICRFGSPRPPSS